MTTGTKVGIGIGVIAAVLGGMLIVWCYHHRQNKRKEKQYQQGRNQWENLTHSHASAATQQYIPRRLHNRGQRHSLEISRPATLDPGRRAVPSRTTRRRQESWPNTGAPLSTELGLEMHSRNGSDAGTDAETASLGWVDTRVGEARMQHETGMEQTAPSSGVMAGTEQLPQYEEPPEYKA